MTAETRQPLVYESLAVGRVFHAGRVAVTAEEIIGFAQRYDPQPFHVDAAAAVQTIFGGLVASGWMTAALTMRLMIGGEFSSDRGVVGLGVETLQWPRPVRPGDELTATVEIIALRASESRPAFGVAKIRTTTLNQSGETVQVLVSNILVPRRPRSP